MNYAVYAPSTTSDTMIVRADALAVQPPVADKTVTDSVLQYIRAVRRLGRTRISTKDIADALHVPHSAVVAAAKALRDEGVKGL